MKIFFDTNVILDVLLDREPFVRDALYLLAKVERSEVTGFICATTVTAIYWLGPWELKEPLAILGRAGERTI